MGMKEIEREINKVRLRENEGEIKLVNMKD